MDFNTNAGLDVYLVRRFDREFTKAGIPKEKFKEAIKEITLSSCDSLGHKLFKKRIGGQGRGKRGAFRAIAYYRDGNLMIFTHLFGKNEKENITDKQKQGLILLAKQFDVLTKARIDYLIKVGDLIKYDENHT